MSLEKRRTLIKAFIESQFNHCPLIWMLHSSIVYRKITWSGRLAQIQIYLEFSRVLSRDQSKCKGNYSVAHKVGRKAKDVS